MTSVLTRIQLCPWRIRLTESSRSLFVIPACRQSTLDIPLNVNSSANEDARVCVDVKTRTGGL